MILPKKFRVLNEKLNKPLALGDAIAVIAQPIAAAVDAATSILPEPMRTDLKHCPACKQRQADKNERVPNINPLARK